MINFFWMFLIVLGLSYSIITGNFDSISNSLLNVPEKAVNILIVYIGIMVFWSGIMEVAKESGILGYISKVIGFILRPFFKKDRVSDDTYQYICANVACNMFGMSSASTSLGLKAMRELDKNNQNKDVPSKEMRAFVLLNSISVTLLPTTIIQLRSSYESKIIYNIVFIIFMIGLISVLFALSINNLWK